MEQQPPFIDNCWLDGSNLLGSRLPLQSAPPLNLEDSYIIGCGFCEGANFDDDD